MDKFQFRLLVCLVVIFGFTAAGFMLTSSDESGSSMLTGAAVGLMVQKNAHSNSIATYLPGMLFLGLVILALIYLSNS
jgi:hypothetical protein